MTADHDDCDLRGLRSAIRPPVARPVLNKGVTHLQVHFLSLIQFEPDLAGEDEDEIDGIGGVHSRMVRFHDGEEPGTDLPFYLCPARGSLLRSQSGLGVFGFGLRRQR